MTIWQQPKNQRIESSSQATLFHESIEFAYKFDDRWKYYFGIEHKNAGWVAGNVYLDDSYQIWTGVRAGIF